MPLLSLGGRPPYPRCPRGVAPSTHMWVTVVGGRDERLLDRPGGDPADQVEHRARLVVGAAGPRAAKRLLADHRAGWLVVDVEVARAVAELVARPRDRRAGGSEDR